MRRFSLGEYGSFSPPSGLLSVLALRSPLDVMVHNILDRDEVIEDSS